VTGKLERENYTKQTKMTNKEKHIDFFPVEKYEKIVFRSKDTAHWLITLKAISQIWN